MILGIAPECNVYSWTENNGFYIPSWSTDAFKQVVKDYRLLYEEGGLDPDFYTKSPSAVMDDFAAGRLGALEYKSSPPSLMELKNRWDALNDKSFEDCVDVLPVFPAQDGIRYRNGAEFPNSDRLWLCGTGIHPVLFCWPDPADHVPQEPSGF